jgi:ABC-type multidrug transport system ATPase subunit
VVSQLFELVAGFPQRGTSVLLVEQFVGKALELASRAYVLEKGQVRYAGDAKELAADPEFVRSSYLGSAEAEVSSPPPGARLRSRDAAGENVTVSLPPELMRSLTERAERDGVALGELVARALRGDLAPETQGEQTTAGAQP